MPLVTRWRRRLHADAGRWKPGERFARRGSPRGSSTPAGAGRLAGGADWARHDVRPGRYPRPQQPARRALLNFKHYCQCWPAEGRWRRISMRAIDRFLKLCGTGVRNLASAPAGFTRRPFLRGWFPRRLRGRVDRRPRGAARIQGRALSQRPGEIESARSASCGRARATARRCSAG